MFCGSILFLVYILLLRLSFKGNARVEIPALFFFSLCVQSQIALKSLTRMDDGLTSFDAIALPGKRRLCAESEDNEHMKWSNFFPGENQHRYCVY